MACVVCCALPVLITAGGIGAGAVLAVLAAGTFLLGRRRRSGSCSYSPKAACGGGRGCARPGEPVVVGGRDAR
ncbi:MYXO-CTERM sorting domain-containing protein [Streptomyces sp. NPDC004838]